MKLPSIVPLLLLALFLPATFSGCGEDEGERIVERNVEYRDKPSASVSGELALPDEVPNQGVMVYAEGTSHVAFTNDEGEFVLSGLPEGEYRLRATRQDLQERIIGNITITEGDLEKSQPFQSLSRVMMDAKDEDSDGSGRSVAQNFGSLQGTVRTEVPGEEGGVLVNVQGIPTRTATFPDGSYELYRLDPGSYVLEFSKQGYDTEILPVEVKANETTQAAEVALSGGGEQPESLRTVYGTVEVLNADGSAFENFSNIRVVLEGTSYATTPDSSGGYEIQDVEPGTYVVNASLPGYLLEERQQVDLSSVSAAEANLVLLEDTTEEMTAGTIQGRAVLEDPPSSGHGGIAVSLVGTSHVAFTDQGGQYRITGIEQGTYDLMATFNGYESATLENVTIDSFEPVQVEELQLEKEVERPRVVSTMPADGQTDVMIRQPTEVRIQFSTDMNASSVRNAISISPDVAYQISTGQGPGRGRGVFTLLLNAIPQDGAEALRYGTEYRVTIASSAANLEGISMEGPYEFEFTTGYPMITSTQPADGATEAAFLYEEPIWIYFNAPINPETLDEDTITFDPELPGSPNIYHRRDPDTGWSVLQLQGRGEYDTRYEVEISSRVRTISGQRVRNTPYTWTFETRELQTFDEAYGTGDLDYDPMERERRRNP